MKPKNFPGRVAVRRARAKGDHSIEQYDMRMRVGARFRDEDGNIVALPPGFPKTFVEHGMYIVSTTYASKVCKHCHARFLSRPAREKHEAECEKRHEA